MSATAPRKIGPVLATFLVANNMIGSGFFLLPVDFFEPLLELAGPQPGLLLPLLEHQRRD